MKKDVFLLRCLIIALLIVNILIGGIYFRGLIGEIELNQIKNINLLIKNQIDYQNKLENKDNDILNQIKTNEILTQTELTSLKADIVINKANNTILNYLIYDTYFKKPSYDYLKDRTIEVGGYNEEGEFELIGTGIVIKKTADFTYILTNKHVAEALKKEDTFIRAKEIIKPVTNIQVSDKVDLGIIQVMGNLPKEVVNTFAIPKISDRLYVVGHHLGIAFTYSEGIMSNPDLSSLSFAPKSIYIQVPLMFGNSGSGIFNKNGELVGMCAALITTPAGVDSSYSICVRIEDILEFIKETIGINE